MKGLAGKRILVTRSSKQAEETGRDLRRLGAKPILFPCLDFRYNPQQVKHGLALLKKPETEVLFTSSNAIHAVHKQLKDKFSSFFENIPVAVVGTKTAAVATSFGIRPQLVPKEFSQEGLFAAYQQRGFPKRLIFFRAARGRDWLLKMLEDRGVTVHLIPSYQCVLPDDDPAPIIQALLDNKIDAVLLGSSKTAINYVSRVGNSALAGKPVVAVLSNHVAKTARELSLGVQVVATEASFETLLLDMEKYFEQLETRRDGIYANH
ncbi:MAG: uroporphyrinogen-III synthase [Mariprofundaceae bacterium]